MSLSSPPIDDDGDGGDWLKGEPAPAAAPGPPKRTFGQILALMRAADDDVLEAEIDLSALGAELRDKVDDIVDFCDACHARAAAIAGRAAQLSAKSAAFRAKADKLLEYVTAHMDSTESLELPGHSFAFRVKYSERVEFKPAAVADPAAYVKFNALAKGAVRRTYSFDKPAFKKLLKAGVAEAMAIASITEHPNLEIKPKA